MQDMGKGFGRCFPMRFCQIEVKIQIICFLTAQLLRFKIFLLARADHGVGFLDCDYFCRSGLMYLSPWAKFGQPPISVQFQFSNLGHHYFPDAAWLSLCSMA